MRSEAEAIRRLSNRRARLAETPGPAAASPARTEEGPRPRRWSDQRQAVARPLAESVKPNPKKDRRGKERTDAAELKGQVGETGSAESASDLSQPRFVTDATWSGQSAELGPETPTRLLGPTGSPLAPPRRARWVLRQPLTLHPARPTGAPGPEDCDHNPHDRRTTAAWPSWNVTVASV